MCLSPSNNFRPKGLRRNSSQGLFPKRHLSGVYATVVECRVCGLIFSSPRPEPINVSEHYSVNPQEYFSEGQLDLGNQPSVISELLKPKLSNFEGPLRALDVGAGIGRNMLLLLHEGFSVTGVEVSKSFFDQATVNLMGYEAELVNQEIENVNLPSESFHLIIMSAVLEHFYNPDTVLDKVFDLLKPGGIVFISVPNGDWLLGRLLNLYHKLMFSRLVTNLSPMHPPYHLYEFTIESFNSYMRRSGKFKLDWYEYTAGEVPLLGSILNRSLRPILGYSKNGIDLSLVLRK